MSVLPVGISGEEPTGYQIERSLRFNSADSAYLNRTPASAGNRKTWTWSGWVKRSVLGSAQRIFVASNNNLIDDTIGFLAGDTLTFYLYNSSYQAQFVTTQVFRDPSSWYHIIVAVDTTQATSTNRVKIYVNGVQVTAFSTATYPTQNLDASGFNTTNPHNIGRYVSGVQYLNGYMTEMNFIDGQALDPTSFGEFNSDTGVWQPKAYTGSYGTNGFYLDFADNSGTTSTTLGADSSGNGNNWTPNNFSVTAGVGNDSLVDSPTRYGTDTGLGGEVRGNYCTLNPLQLAGVSLITLANGNLDIIFAAGSGTTAFRNIAGTIGVSSGKWYWEVTYAGGGTFLLVGITDSATLPTQYTGQTAGSYAYYSTGQKVNNGSIAAYGASYTTNDVIGVALDMDAGTITFYKNNVSQGQAYSGITGTVFPAIGRDGTSNAQFIQPVNFGQRPFAYTAPSGFKALVTTNLPEPTIADGGDYFNAILYTGTGSSNARTGVGFQPDLVWIKGRSGATDHALYDAVRGVQKQLESNTSGAETTETTGLTAFGSDGFTVGALAQLNTSSATYVAWNWKANGAGVSNTAGTITSTVSVNTTSGFSIVTYTGNGSTSSTQTIGHGLGVKPAFIITKNRDSGTAGPGYWSCWHKDIGGTNAGIWLDLTSARNNNMWSGQANISSTVFVPPDLNYGNVSGNKYVNYVFAPVAGYSAFGSYTGNGSADGPFVYTGFRPRFILWKNASATAVWVIIDTDRNTYNESKTVLQPQSSGAESVAGSGLDVLSNGFKLRATDVNWNQNTNTYIYMAFAENPFAYSLAR